MGLRTTLTIIVAATMFTACGIKGDPGDIGPMGPSPSPTPTPNVDVIQQDIDSLVNDENIYRLGLGQSSITNGLSCSVVEIVSGQWLSGSSPGAGAVINTTGKTVYPYLYKGWFNQQTALSGTNNLLPTQLQPLYINKNYKISCSGFIVVTETNYYDFSLESDDGSILTVDGTQVINNDGNHGMTTITNTKFLRRGVRSFSIQYAQTGGGAFGLVLKAGGQTINPRVYFH